MLTTVCPQGGFTNKQTMLDSSKELIHVILHDLYVIEICSNNEIAESYQRYDPQMDDISRNMATEGDTTTECHTIISCK